LWAKFAIDMLKDERIAVDPVEFVQQMPQGIKATVELVLDMHRVTNTEDKNHEFEYIPFWLRDNSMPLALSELYSMLKRSVHNRNEFHRLETRVRDEYGSLLTASRDDGITTTMLRNRDRGYNSIPEATKVAFTHASTSECVKNHQQFASDAGPELAEVQKDVQRIAASKMEDKIRSRDAHDLQATLEYLRSLYLLDGETRWKDIMRVISGRLPSAGAPSPLLVELILQNPWPRETPDNFFFIIAHAAIQTKSSPWLEQVLKDVIPYAQTHLTAIAIKSCIVYLRTDFTKNLTGIEELIGDIGEVAALDEGSSIVGLTVVRQFVAQTYCQLHIKQAMKADSTLPIVEHCLQKVLTLCRTGVHPLELSEKVETAERSLLYLAMLYCRTNNGREARNTVRPLLLECCSIIDSGNPRTSTMAVGALAEISLALDDPPKALGFYRFLHSRSQWQCTSCET
jgi:hypothetical protein